MEAIRVISGQQKTAQGTAVLDALALLGSDGAIRPTESRYAKKLLGLLSAKPEGHVVNRGELIEIVAGGLVPVEKDIYFRLEPEWIGVLLVGLVYGGHIILTLPKGSLDAGSIQNAATMAIQDFVDFQHFGRPKAAPIAVWEEIFTGLGLQAAKMRDEKTRESALTEFLGEVAREKERIARLQSRLGQDLRLWNESIITDNFKLTAEKGAIVGSNLPEQTLTSTDMKAGLRGYKEFIDEISKFNTVGKLGNIKLDATDVGEAATYRKVVVRIERLLEVVSQLQPLTEYLAAAEGALPADHPWQTNAASTKEALITSVRRFGAGEAEINLPGLRADLETLKKSYGKTYTDAHRLARLTQEDDKKRAKLYDDPRLKALKTLSGIDLVNKTDLGGWQQAVTNLQVCAVFTAGMLDQKPVCSCGFRFTSGMPAMSAVQRLKEVDDRLDTILVNWRTALRANLTSDTATASLHNMTANERAPVDVFLAQSDDDPSISDNFVKAAKAALHGISALPLTTDDLLTALASGGFPCTVDELKRRFDTFVAAALRGKDAPTTRLTLTEDES